MAGPARQRLINRRLARQANRTQARNQRLQGQSGGNRLSGGPSRNPPGVRNRIPKYPAAPAAPGVANGAPGNQSAPFLDSTYYANTAQNQFNANEDMSGIRQQDAYNQTDAFTAKARLDQQEPFAEQGLKENAARQGLIGSTRTNTQVGLQQRNYLQQRGDVDLKAARTHAANQAAMQAIQAGLPLQQAAEMAAAADRQTVRDQAAADAGVLAPNPGSSAANNNTNGNGNTSGSGNGNGNRSGNGTGGGHRGGGAQRAARSRRRAVRTFKREQQQVRNQSTGPRRPRHPRSR